MRRRKRNGHREIKTELDQQNNSERGGRGRQIRRGEGGRPHSRQEDSVWKLPLQFSCLPSSPPFPPSWSHKEPLKLSHNPPLFR